jgi:tRNA(adenine34) deaminase
MAQALAEARAAAEAAEVPVGAVVVKDGVVIGRGRNRVEGRGDATAHAELEALAQAAQATGDRRLNGATLYVTLEPCPMCAYAAVLARVDGIVYGAADPKAGACGSVLNVPAAPFNHHVAVRGGVRAEECAEILAEFFLARRGGNGGATPPG